MSTRSGDFDPSIVLWLQGKGGMTPAQIDRMLNHASGLLGVSGKSGDMRELLKARRSAPAKRAVDLFCYRVRKYIGAYLAALGGADAIVFTGGIGENSADIREQILKGLDGLGISIDRRKNRRVKNGAIHSPRSRIKVLVIPTREELMIARETAEIGGSP